MKEDISTFFNYYHDCYRADNRDGGVFDFLSAKLENRIVMAGREELLTKEYPYVPIPKTKASRILKTLAKFQQEKELVYGAFFVVGKYKDLRGSFKTLCAPLFTYPANVFEEGEFAYLKVDIASRRLNYSLLGLLQSEVDLDYVNDPIFKTLPKNGVDFGDLRSITNLFEKYFPSISIENALCYPTNEKLGSIKTKTQFNFDNDTKELIAGGVAGIITKSVVSRGVLNELKALGEGEQLSAPLLNLFREKKEGNSSFYKSVPLPLSLSVAQKAILKSASEEVLSVIVGPPGTGKTFTIGAIALEHMSRGESVLIACRTDEAVDVVAHKIDQELGIKKGIVRVGKKRAYKTPLSRYLKALLTRTWKLTYLAKEFGLPKHLKLEGKYASNAELLTKIETREKYISNREKEFKVQVENELKWGWELSKESEGIIDLIKEKWIKFKNARQYPVWKTFEELYNAKQLQIEQVNMYLRYSYIAQVLKTIENDFESINLFRESLKLASDTQRNELFKSINWDSILKAFPIWLTNLNEVKDAVPFEKELFDVVIIDEATQCDIASCIPLMQRAKRVVFAGDPSQIKHISFLSSGMQSVLQDKYQLNNDPLRLDYRNVSMLDLAMHNLKGANQVNMLDEHFRSHKSIIDFSNKHFYEDQLRIMTSKPLSSSIGLELHSVNGTRDAKGYNEAEALLIVSKVEAIINQEEEVDTFLCRSIGILSPFKDQVDLLKNLIYRSLTAEQMEKHSIYIGTAYSFQGSERDVMFLSFALDNHSHHSAFIHLNKPDIFNVSITRAKKAQYVYYSFDKASLKKGSLVSLYLDSYKSNQRNTVDENTYRDQFLKEVQTFIKKGIRCKSWVDYEIAGVDVDLLIHYKEAYYAIDLIGYPGSMESDFGMEGYDALERAAIKMFPLPFSDWHFDSKKVREDLMRFLKG